MKNCILFMLIVVMFGFTSCSTTKDEVMNEVINRVSDKFEKQQYTPQSTPPLRSNISTATDTTTTRETFPLINTGLSNAIKNIIDAALAEYPNYFIGGGNITYAKTILHRAATMQNFALMNAIKDAFLNPPNRVDDRFDNIKIQLNAINAGEGIYIANFTDKLRNNPLFMDEIQDFCNIVDCFYEIQRIRSAILTDDSNFSTLVNQLSIVYNKASEISDSGTCLPNREFATAVNFLKSLVSAIRDNDLSTIIALNNYLKANDNSKIGSLSLYFTDDERNNLINAIDTTYSLH
ncbi:MAG: hypothetical protein LBU10_05965 [Endomicrobium sp.]|jgi:hypothetical protein|nr:hypothetical protein [Endomicrobium sp.]